MPEAPLAHCKASSIAVSGERFHVEAGVRLGEQRPHAASVDTRADQIQGPSSG
jgi:hypothetical protein